MGVTHQTQNLVFQPPKPATGGRKKNQLKTRYVKNSVKNWFKNLLFAQKYLTSSFTTLASHGPRLVNDPKSGVPVLMFIYFIKNQNLFIWFSIYVVSLVGHLPKEFWYDDL